MDEKDNITDIKDYLRTNEKAKPQQDFGGKFVTNPVAKNFIKYFSNKKDKFSIKDILR